MKKILYVILCLMATSAFAQEINLTGVYKGKGIYIKNPYLVDSGRFCVKEVLVNGKKSNVSLRLTAVHLTLNELELFTPVTIKVIHEDSCNAKIINPQAVLYHTSFKFDSLVLNDSIMHWYTKGDRAEGVFKIEKLHYGSWETVKEVFSKGSFEGAQYVYFPEHSDGGNKYRIKYELPNGRYLYSSEMEHYHYPETVTFSPRVVKDFMNLSREARYEIMDSDGDVILKGKGKKIPLRLLKPGDYSIMLEGEVDTFVKK